MICQKCWIFIFSKEMFIILCMFMHWPNMSDCERSNDRFYSNSLSNKTQGGSASLKLWHLIVYLFVLRIFKKLHEKLEFEKKCTFCQLGLCSHFYQLKKSARISTIFEVWWWNKLTWYTMHGLNEYDILKIDCWWNKLFGF